VARGRSHAARLAQQGADIIAVDLCDQIDTVLYPIATKAGEADALGPRRPNRACGPFFTAPSRGRIPRADTRRRYRGLPIRAATTHSF